MITTVLFDMDGLLLDTELYWGESMLKIAAKHGIPITREHFKATTGLRIFEVTEYWQRNFPWQGASSEQVANEVLDDITAVSIAKGNIMPGVINLLQQLRAAHYKIGLASSSPMRMIQPLIQHFELSAYFDAVCSADAVEYGKPHPAVFLYAANQLQAQQHECLVLEDSLNGVIAAKAARMKVIAVPDAHQLHNPAFSIADLVLPSLVHLDDAQFKAITGHSF